MWFRDISATWGVCNSREACRTDSRKDLSTNNSLLDPRAKGFKPPVGVIRGSFATVATAIEVPREPARALNG
jgi:hypothetical protein